LGVLGGFFSNEVLFGVSRLPVALPFDTFSGFKVLTLHAFC